MIWSESAYAISIVLAFIKILYIFQDTKVTSVNFLNRKPSWFTILKMLKLYFSESDQMQL